MKYLVTLFAIFFTVSCTRDPSNTTPAIEDGSFQYKVNGNLVTMNNISISAGEYVIFAKQLPNSFIPRTRYMFNGQKGVNNIWIFGIETDSLTARNYALDSTNGALICTMTYNGPQSALYFSGDNMIINITSHSNGFISGNFTAKFSPIGSSGFDYSTKGTTLITEGQFKNIKCIY